MYSTWAYQCRKYTQNQILSSVRAIFDPYWHQLLSSYFWKSSKKMYINLSLLGNEWLTFTEIEQLLKLLFAFDLKVKQLASQVHKCLI